MGSKKQMPGKGESEQEVKQALVTGGLIGRVKNAKKVGRNTEIVQGQ